MRARAARTRSCCKALCIHVASLLLCPRCCCSPLASHVAPQPTCRACAALAPTTSRAVQMYSRVLARRIQEIHSASPLSGEGVSGLAKTVRRNAKTVGQSVYSLSQSRVARFSPQIRRFVFLCVRAARGPRKSLRAFNEYETTMHRLPTHTPKTQKVKNKGTKIRPKQIWPTSDRADIWPAMADMRPINKRVSKRTPWKWRRP